MPWLPKSVVCLSYYDRFRFRADILAALILAQQLFPLSIAIAIAVGLDPRYGVSCAAIAVFLASALGDSKIRVSAPSVVFVAVASSIVAREGISGLSLSTLLAGVLLMLFGAMGLGAAIQMLPRPVTAGFATGIAILIASQQLPHLLGIRMQMPSHQVFQGPLTLIGHGIQIKQYEVVIAVLTLILTMVGRRRFRYIPTGLIVMIVGALLVKFGHSPVRTVEILYRSNLPSFHLYGVGAFRLDLLGDILAQAFAIAVLVAIESLQAISLASSLSGERFNPDGELFVHGGVNVASAFVGGLPGSGVSSYTSENAHLGAQTPIAGILQAGFLMVFLLIMAPLIRFVPLAASRELTFNALKAVRKRAAFLCA
jgi:SulP family sulfate permease